MISLACTGGFVGLLGRIVESGDKPGEGSCAVVNCRDVEE